MLIDANQDDTFKYELLEGTTDKAAGMTGFKHSDSPLQNHRRVEGGLQKGNSVTALAATLADAMYTKGVASRAAQKSNMRLMITSSTII